MPNPELVFWDDWLLILIQFVGMVALIVYVKKTWEIAEETRHAAEVSHAALQEAKESRLAGIAPRIMIYFSPEIGRSADIVVENIGLGTAENVTFRFEPQLQSSWDDIQPGAFFDTPKVLPPGYRLKHTIDFWDSYLSGGLPKKYVVHVTYTGVEDGRTHSVDHVLDVSSFEHLTQEDEKGISHVVNEVKHLHKEVRDGLEKLHRFAERAHQEKIYRGDDLSAPTAIQHLLISWRVLAFVYEHPEGSVRWDAALNVVREKAFTAAYAAVAEALPASTQTVMLELLAQLTKLRGMIHRERFEQLRQVFVEIEQLYPEHRLIHAGDGGHERVQHVSPVAD